MFISTMYRLAKPSTFQNTPAIYHHLKSWDDIQNGRHWSSFCEIRWIFYIQKYLTNHGLSVNENYANEQPSILYILEYLYIILTCRRHPLSFRSGFLLFYFTLQENAYCSLFWLKKSLLILSWFSLNDHPIPQ